MAEQFDVTFYAPWVAPLLSSGRELPTGGAETQIVMLARALSARGAHVCLVTYDTGEPLPERVDGVRVRVQGRPTPETPVARAIAYVWSLLRTLGPLRTSVLLQRAAGPATGLIALLARLKRARFVYSSAAVTDFDYDRFDPKRGNVFFFHLGVRLASEVVVQTPEQVELCLRRFGRHPALIKSLAEPAEQRTGEGEAFLWVGRLAPYKRPEAYLELARTVPEASFQMVAVPAGAIGAELEERIAREASELPNLELLEPRPRAELLPLMERAVAIVNTADKEGMPNTFLEGWARGVPALALNHDPDGVIEREEIGGFAGGSPERLARLAREMWQARGRQAELAARCRGYIAREHSEDAVVGKWMSVLGITEPAKPSA